MEIIKDYPFRLSMGECFLLHAMAIVMGMLMNVGKLAINVWELLKKRPNIRFDIGYPTKQETTQDITSVLHVTSIKDYDMVEITLTNVGCMPAALKELKVVIQGKDISLCYSTEFSFFGIPHKTKYFSSSYGLRIRENTGGVRTLNGGIGDYNSGKGPLKTLNPQEQHIIKIKNELFSYDIDDIYITDTIGNKWSINKKSLNSFKKEWKETNNQHC